MRKSVPKNAIVNNKPSFKMLAATLLPQLTLGCRQIADDPVEEGRHVVVVACIMSGNLPAAARPLGRVHMQRLLDRLLVEIFGHRVFRKTRKAALSVRREAVARGLQTAIDVQMNIKQPCMSKERLALVCRARSLTPPSMKRREPSFMIGSSPKE